MKWTEIDRDSHRWAPSTFFSSQEPSTNLTVLCLLDELDRSLLPKTLHAAILRTSEEPRSTLSHTSLLPKTLHAALLRTSEEPRSTLSHIDSTHNCSKFSDDFVELLNFCMTALDKLDRSWLLDKLDGSFLPKTLHAVPLRASEEPRSTLSHINSTHNCSKLTDNFVMLLNFC